MKQTQTALMTLFSLFMAVAVVTVILFEAGWLPTGLWASDKQSEFVMATVMELLTIAAAPLALRLFRFRRVEQELTSAGALRKWGGLRLLMLGLPFWANLLLYYMYMNVAFCYLAIILFLCFFFVVPTMGRCQSEIKTEDA